MSLEGINVCIRVRPFIQREIDANETNGDDWLVNGDSNYIQSTIPGKKQMNFDRVFDNYATNGMIYDEAAKRIIDSAFEGVNGTILAYGQTSSGKTFTMSSVMREAFSNIFNRVRNDKTRSYEVSASYCEVYNEVITDLADVTKTGLAVAQDTGLVRDLTIRPMGSEQDILRFHEDGTKNRKVGATKMNAESSRSHSIFQLFVKSYPIDAPKSSLPQGVARTKVNTAGTLEATINFVDLGMFFPNTIFFLINFYYFLHDFDAPSYCFFQMLLCCAHIYPTFSFSCTFPLHFFFSSFHQFPLFTAYYSFTTTTFESINCPINQFPI